METVIGAVLKQRGLVLVSPLVEVMSQFMVDGDKILVADLNAHLQAHVILVVNVPRAGMADNIAVARLDEQGPLPEGLGCGRKAQRRKEILAIMDHSHL